MALNFNRRRNRQPLRIASLRNATAVSALMMLSAGCLAAQCDFQSASLAGGIVIALDPSAPGPPDVLQTATSSAGRCGGQGVTMTVTANNGLHGTNNLQDMSGNRIPYSIITSNPVSSHNEYVNFTVSIRILASSYVNARAGAYTDTITLTVAP